MGLALVQVALPHFQQIHAHMTIREARYRNMHLRAVYPNTKPAQMKHLHAVYAAGATEIEGMISGREVFCHYRLLLVRGAAADARSGGRRVLAGDRSHPAAIPARLAESHA